MGLDPAFEVTPVLPRGFPVASAVRYTGLARHYLLRAKLGRRQELFEPMGRMLLAVFRQLSCRPGCIVPVPSHPWDTWTRGFTPSVEIARALSRATGIPIRPVLRRRWRPRTSFKQLSRENRRILAARAFRVRRALNGESVLLVDDLMTTGSTLAACSHWCSRAGASEIHGLVWAKAISSF
jgi:predicted amidophosphoribosyltransferase